MAGAYFPIGHYESPEAIAQRELFERVTNDRSQRLRNMVELAEQQSAQTAEVRRARTLLEEQKRREQASQNEQLQARATAAKRDREEYVNEERERKRKAYVETRTRAIPRSTTHYRALEQPVDNASTMQLSEKERLSDASDYETFWQYARGPHDIRRWQREKALADERQAKNDAYGKQLLAQAATERAVATRQRNEQLREEQIRNEQNAAAIKAFLLESALAKRAAGERVARDMQQSIQAQRCKREKEERGHVCGLERSAAVRKLVERKLLRDAAKTVANCDSRQNDADSECQPSDKTFTVGRNKQKVVVDGQRDNKPEKVLAYSDPSSRFRRDLICDDRQPWLQHYQHKRNECQRARYAQGIDMHDQFMAEYLQRGHKDCRHQDY